MALTTSKLSRIGYANGQGLHIYRTDDTLATVVASGYFNSVTNNLMKGDVILVVANEASAAGAVPVVVTSASKATTVTTVAGAQQSLTGTFGTSTGALASLTSLDGGAYATSSSFALALIASWKPTIDNNIGEIRAILRKAGLVA